METATATDNGLLLFTSFQTLDSEYRIALNNGLNESSGLMEREGVKQLIATPLNSLSQGQTRQRPCSDTLHVKNVFIVQLGLGS